MEIIQEGKNWRIGLVPDEFPYDDSYVDTWNETNEKKAKIKQELQNRIESDGVWGLVAQIKCEACGAWEYIDSIGGFIGMDWQNSGYDDEMLTAIKKRAEGSSD